MENMDNNNNNP